ncbi:MAG: hypothetical protein ACLUQW_10175 [Collinsella sp.]
MKQTTNTAATILEQVNAMPAATWGWLKMNQTKLELSDELAAAPTEAVEVEGLTSSLPAWQTRLKPPWTLWPSVSPSAALRFGDAADRARITPETELDVPATSVYRPVYRSRRSSPLPRPSRLAWARLLTPPPPTTPPSASSSMCPHTSTPRLPCASAVDAAAAIAAIDVVARPQSTPIYILPRLPLPARVSGSVTRVRPRVRHRQRPARRRSTIWIALDDTGRSPTRARQRAAGCRCQRHRPRRRPVGRYRQGHHRY